jgi:hypothetical protein
MLYSQIWLKFLVDNHQFSLVFSLVRIFFQNEKSKKKRNILSKYSIFSSKNNQFQKELLKKIFSPYLNFDYSQATYFELVFKNI